MELGGAGARRSSAERRSASASMSFFTNAAVAASRRSRSQRRDPRADELVRQKKNLLRVGIAVGVTRGGCVVRSCGRRPAKSFAEMRRGHRRRLPAAPATHPDASGPGAAARYDQQRRRIRARASRPPILSQRRSASSACTHPAAAGGTRREVVISPMMYLALLTIHSIVDGQEAVQFLVRITQ